MEQTAREVYSTSNLVQNTLLTSCTISIIMHSAIWSEFSDQRATSPHLTRRHQTLFLACVKGSRHKTRHTFNVTKLHSKKNNVYTYFEWAWSVVLHSNGAHVWYINLHSFWWRGLEVEGSVHRCSEPSSLFWTHLTCKWSSTFFWSWEWGASGWNGTVPVDWSA